ncbi:MAG: PVC-type heme-binding CxxCH protein, partial [Verrucomicrobiota bacterium]
MKLPQVLLLVLLPLIRSGALAAAPVPMDGPLSPARAEAVFEVAPGVRVELAAAEPLIESPCALAWDEAGRLYVAENRGYPTGAPDGQPLGRITRLEDPDGDGRYDQARVFADGLSFPNGLMPWRGGLIVTCAPDLLWLRDADCYGRAEQREVWLTGFATNQSTQLRVNKPMLAPDGWIYLASGLSGGRLTNPRQPQVAAWELKGDLRFDPDTGRLEGLDGRSQFGQSFDDFGRRFGVHNRVQVQHFVLPSAYLSRNPEVAPPGAVENCPETVDNPWMTAGGGAARLYLISANLTTADSHAGTFSAACAVHVWRGGLLPASYLGGVFSCDPTANLVHFDRLEPRGATFAARGPTNGTEFLRSPDSWFRPVYLATGPDGALYVADLYRRTIEHPDYLPAAVRARTDFRSGQDQGRIWRIRAARPPGRTARMARARRDRPVPGLDFPTEAPGWVAELASTNAWRRDTAFRRLREARPATAYALLERTVTNASPGFAVVPALTLLDSVDLLPEHALRSALEHPEAGVREFALRLAERRLPATAALLAATLDLAGDGDPRVRFQAALALGFATPERADLVIPALARVAMLDGRDRWARAAILSSMAGAERAFLAALFRQPNTPGDPVAPMLDTYGTQLGRHVLPEDRGEVLNVLFSQPAFNLERTLAFMGGYGDGLRAAGGTFAASLTQASGAAMGTFRVLTGMARNLAAATNTEPGLRGHAIRVLGLDTNAASLPVLARLLDDAPPPLDRVALEALARRPEPEAA